MPVCIYMTVEAYKCLHIHGSLVLHVCYNIPMDFIPYLECFVYF